MDMNIDPTEQQHPYGTYNRQGEIKRAVTKPYISEKELKIRLVQSSSINNNIQGVRLIVDNKSLIDIPLLTTLGSVAEGLIRKRHPLELDLSQVESISSMCIGVIMNIYLASTQENIFFQVNAHSEIKEKLDLCSVGSIINIKG